MSKRLPRWIDLDGTRRSPIPKPVREVKPKRSVVARAKRKRRTQSQQRTARKRCVNFTWIRACHLCEVCEQVCTPPRYATYLSTVGHVHEIVYRSLGGDPTDSDNTCLLCARCHADEHAKIIKIHRRLTGETERGIEWSVLRK